MNPFAIEQDRFGEAMRFLIEMYYMPSQERLFEIFGLTIPNFFPCVFYDGENAIQYRYTDYMFLQGFEYFRHFMSLFHKECANSINCHFNIVGFDHEINNVSDPSNRNFSVTRKQVSAMYSKTPDEQRVYEIWQQGLYEFPRIFNVDMLMKDSKEEVKKIFSGVQYPPAHYERYHVLGITEFGKLLRIPILSEYLNWQSEINYPKDFPDDIPVIIKSPGHPDSRNLIQFVQAFFVKFQAIFGSYDRVKICKYQPCSKLFYVGRIGKEFCSNQCRMRYNAEGQSAEVRLCRERQNQWLRHWINNRKIKYSFNPLPNHIQKSDCTNCASPVATPLCPVLEKRNKEMFAEVRSQRSLIM